MGQANLARFVAGLDVSTSAAGHQAFQSGLAEAFIISAGLSAVGALLAGLPERSLSSRRVLQG
jgi:hypothetical protein